MNKKLEGRILWRTKKSNWLIHLKQVTTEGKHWTYSSLDYIIFLSFFHVFLQSNLLVGNQLSIYDIKVVQKKVPFKKESMLSMGGAIMTSQRKFYLVKTCSTVRKRAKRTWDTSRNFYNVSLCILLFYFILYFFLKVGGI